MTAIALANLRAKTDLFANPIGLDEFEFVELVSPKQGILEPIFEMFGFSKVTHRRSKSVVLFRQGDINFIINHKPTSQTASLLKSMAQALAA